MTLPAMWIRKNMLQSPGPSPCSNDRTPTEAEIKVQRSLQKLSIPEWYLNNNSRPPKILTNDTPIESRPPVWKEQLFNKSIVSNTSIMPARNLTINRNGVLETEIGPPQNQSYGTYKITRTSPTEKSPMAKKRISSSQTNHVPEKKLSRSRLPKISRTFPRVSPSRKIQNINIVFPQTPKLSLSHRITDIDSENCQMDMTKDSLDESTPPKIIETDLDTSHPADESLMSNSSGSKVYRMPNQHLTYIKPWKSPVPYLKPEEKFSNDHSFKFLACSTPQESPVSLINDLAVDPTSLDQKKVAEVFLFPKVPRQPPMVSSRTVKSIVPEEEEICDACKADVSRRNSPSPHNRPLSGLRQRTLLPIDEKAQQTPRQRLAASSTVADSPTVAFFTSKKKSSQLENIIKHKDPRKYGKSLVQEIIEELNEKCRNSAQSTYVTHGSKNFVKKLVRALEKGTTPISVEEEPEKYYERLCDGLEAEEDDEEMESSEDDVKSAAASTSISYKDTDSSDSELRSPTMKQNYSYDWNMNVEKNRNEIVTLDSETKILDKDEESVYWIPVTKSKLPRTSSLLSMISKLSTNTPGQQSPCVSPIKASSEGRKSQTYSWGMTYRTSDYARTLRRIDETTILDSGYSDRSRGHSSGSSDEMWFDDTEAMQTGSESGSCSSFSHGTFYRRSKIQLLGRPFVI